jgi:hypothetical protein
MESTQKWEERMKKREKALQKRLESLPKDNPLVKSALEEKEEMKDRNDKEEKWEVVNRLQSEAYCMYFDEDKSFKETVKALAEALQALV